MPKFDQLKKQQRNALNSIMPAGFKNAVRFAPEKYDDAFIMDQVDAQKDFYRDYKQKWKRDYEGQKVYESAYMDQQDIQEQFENLSYRERRTRRNEAKQNKVVWENKINSIGGAQEAYGFSLSNKPETYAKDLMVGTLKFTKIEEKKALLQNEVFKDKEKSELFTRYEDEILALAPKIKLNMDNITDDPVFDEESVNSYKAYLEKALENPVEVLKNSVSDTINSMGNLSPKLLSRHAIPQNFDTLKDYRDRYKAIDSLMQKRALKDDSENDVGKMLKDLYEKKDKNGKLLDVENYRLASSLYKAIDADLRYSLNHYGVNFNDNGELLDQVDQHNAAYHKTNGDLAQTLMLNQVKKQTKGLGRITKTYWRDEAQKVIKKDREEDEAKPMVTKMEENILKAVGALDAKKGKLKDENKQKVFDRMTVNAAKIAAAITAIHKELEDSNDVFERQAKEFELRPELKRRVEMYIKSRKQEQLDLIDRAGGYIEALNCLVNNEDFTPLAKRILSENQMSEQEKEYNPKEGEKTLIRKKKAENDSFIVIDNVKLQDTKGSVLETLAAFVSKNTPYVETKKKLLNKFDKKTDDASQVVKLTLEDEKAPEYIRMIKMEGLDIFKMEAREIADKFIEYDEDNDKVVASLKKSILETYKAIDEHYSKLMDRENMANKEDKDVNELIRSAGELRSRYMATRAMFYGKTADGKQEFKTLIRPHIQNKDVARFNELSKIADMKFKIICDKVLEYRCRKLVERIEAGDTNSDIFTDTEREYIDKNTAKLKDKTREQFMVEFYTKKKEAIAVSRSAHVVEFNNFMSNILGKEALKDEEGFIPKKQRKNVKKEKPKTIDEILKLEEEENILENEIDENKLDDQLRDSLNKNEDEDDEELVQIEVEKKEEKKEEKEEEKEEKEDEEEIPNEEELKEYEETLKKVKESLKDYDIQVEEYSLLDEKKEDEKKLDPDVYKEPTTQKETLSCWAASHSYVMRMYVNQYGEDLKKDTDNDVLQPDLPVFIEKTFKDMKNYTINPVVEQKMEEEKEEKEGNNQNNAEVINYQKEAENIKAFLTQNRMGNPFTVADTVISKLQRTAERHVVFALKNYTNITLDKEEEKKIGDYVLKRFRDDLFRTKVPASLLYRGHYYSVIGVKGRTLECFDSRKKGKAIKEPVYLKIDDVVGCKKFEVTFPEYLSDENLENIKEEFGIKKDLYDENGQINDNGDITKLVEVQMGNPVNMMHNHGTAFEKSKDKQEKEFQKLFSEEIYMPNNLNLPLQLKKEKRNQNNK